jgi:hypothetical protein
MTLDDAAKEDNAELVGLLMAMAATPDLEERRRLFRGEHHRLFDPGFYPSLLEVIGLMIRATDGEPEKQSVPIAILGLIGRETQALLAELDDDDLSPLAACLDIAAGPITVLAMQPADGDPAQRGMVELAKGVIRRQGWIVEERKRSQLWAAIEELAQEFEERDGHDGGGAGFSLRAEAERWRGFPDQLSLFARLLECAEHAAPPSGIDNPFAAIPATEWLEQALREEGHHQQAEAMASIRGTIHAGMLRRIVGAGEAARRSEPTGGPPSHHAADGPLPETVYPEFDDYLTRLGWLGGPWAEEPFVRRALAGHGVAIAPPLIRAARAKLASFGTDLDHPQRREFAERFVGLVMQRLINLLNEVIWVGSDGPAFVAGSLVGARLGPFLSDRDPVLRALTVVVYQFVDVPTEVSALLLAGVFTAPDQDPLVRVAAASALFGLPDGVPPEMQGIAGERFLHFIRQTAPGLDALRRSGQGDRFVLGVIELFGRLIARRAAGL